MSACCGAQRSGNTPDARPVPAAAQQASQLETLAARAPEQLRLLGLAGGSFLMGSEDELAYRADGEGPVREVAVPPFAIAATAVTVAEFAVFVLATGYRSDAEVHGDSLVFAGNLSNETRRLATPDEHAPWWCTVAGANWQRPEGPDSDALKRANHPVTHVSLRDALSYAQWVGARLPSEAEWEFAARGGLEQQPYPWGAEFEPGGQARMKTFAGEFPHGPTSPVGTVEVAAYPPNGFGLYNMTGNVWEWTSGTFSAEDPRPAVRGGSHMCHASYCRRYRTSARTAVTADTSLAHTGFRLAADVN
ncbi:formylglycine-generating enzyme family protein [Glutamicibacter sp. AOP33-2CA-4]|uniref:formylglycine-generating enzyme family protein n=1 Tax=Glutamicibacter sp. AOP33-2CA-4 TaxID=3457690 RepID=UPI0040342DF7